MSRPAWTTGLVALWAVLAEALALFSRLAELRAPFAGPHGWHEAGLALLARNFAEHGVLALRGLLIQNNPPWSAVPDAYTHWPPLFPLLLGGVFGAVGSGEAPARALMIGLMLVETVALFVLVRLLLDLDAALIATFGFLVSPLVWLDAGMREPGILPEHLALAFLLVALAAVVKASGPDRLDRTWAIVGCLAFALAVAAAWQPLIAALGLLVVALFARDRKAALLAGLLVATGVAVAVLVIGLYAVSLPQVLPELWQTIAARAHLAPYRPRQIDVYAIANYVEHASYPPVTTRGLLLAFAERLPLIGGGVAVVAIVWCWVRAWRAARGASEGPLVLMVGSLSGLWLGWFVLVPHYTHIHEYQMILGVPLAAVGLGLLGRDAIGLLGLGGPATSGRRRAGLVVLLLVVPAVMVAPMVDRVVLRPPPQRPADWRVQVGLAIGARTEPGAIVLTPDRDMVPVYYSRRHAIRGIVNDHAVAMSFDRVRELFKDAPIFLAIPGLVWARDRFPGALATLPPVVETPGFVLLRVYPGPGGNDAAWGSQVRALARGSRPK